MAGSGVVKGDRRPLVTAPKGLDTALEVSREFEGREPAQQMGDLRFEIVKMKCDLLEAIWRGTALMMSLLTALLVSVLGILILLVVKL